MSAFSSPSIFQLAQIASSIKDYIDNKSGSEGSENDFSEIMKYLKGTLTFAELNNFEFSKQGGGNFGVYFVINTSKALCGIFIYLQSMAFQIGIYFGPTNAPEGSASEIKMSTISSYDNQPGISIAIRYSVPAGGLFSGSNIPSGLSDWTVKTLANYNGGFQFGSAN